MSIKLGDKITYTGLNDSPYFTNGLIYEVVGDHGPDMWYITDNEGMGSNGGNGHAWPKRDIHEYFRLASPVRTETVTKRRIVPGVYGRMRIWADSPSGMVRWSVTGQSGVNCHDMTATELDDIAMVASQLAEALRDVD